MPFGDGTGPAGQGPKSGRGAGPAGFQRGFGRAAGRRGAFAVSGSSDEVSQLKNQTAYLESALENVRKQIESLEGKTGPE